MLGMPLSTLSTYLTSSMLGRGDAKRIANPSDGRSVPMSSRTAAGVVRTVNPAFTRALMALEANLDRPVAEVRATLTGIVDAIDRADASLATPDETDTSSQYPPAT